MSVCCAGIGSGIEVAGAREMAIRDADMAIVYFAQHDLATFERIGALPPLFELRKQVR